MTKKVRASVCIWRSRSHVECSKYVLIKFGDEEEKENGSGEVGYGSLKFNYVKNGLIRIKWIVLDRIHFRAAQTQLDLPI